MRRWSRARAGEGPAAGTGAPVRRCRSLRHVARAAHGDAGGATGRGRAEASRGCAPAYEVRQAGALIPDTVRPDGVDQKAWHLFHEAASSGAGPRLTCRFLVWPILASALLVGAVRPIQQHV